MAVAGIYSRQRPSATYCLKKALSSAVPLALSTILRIMCSVGGYFAILDFAFLFLIPVIVIEKHSFLSSFNRSRQVLMSSTLNNLCTVVFLQIVLVVGLMLVAAVGNRFGLREVSVMLIFVVFAQVLWAVTYLNIRIKYEGLTASKLCQELGIDPVDEVPCHNQVQDNEDLNKDMPLLEGLQEQLREVHPVVSPSGYDSDEYNSDKSN
jgi:hypothetical protein